MNFGIKLGKAINRHVCVQTVVCVMGQQDLYDSQKSILSAASQSYKRHNSIFIITLYKSCNQHVIMGTAEHGGGASALPIFLKL